MMAKLPPGRSILEASAMTACVACRGSSCMTRQIETRSTELSARPVCSAAACLNLHVVMRGLQAGRSMLYSLRAWTSTESGNRPCLVRMTCI